MTDHYFAAQQAAEQHIEACQATLDDDVEPDGDYAPMAPYCGCLTCEVREILYAAEPHLRKAWEEERGDGS